MLRAIKFRCRNIWRTRGFGGRDWGAGIFMTQHKFCVQNSKNHAPTTSSTTSKGVCMTEFKHYRRTQIAEMRPATPEDALDGSISVSAPDKANGSPRPGDMIARNPKNH